VKWEYIVSYHGTVEADTSDEADSKALDVHHDFAEIVAVQTERKDAA
jgi:hypothetical protein